ncbi:MAG: BatA domain-containing protein [Chitinophagales bacterium]
MQFLFPSFLWALAALAIPVIVHLFNFRRHKTIYFSNVAFLKEVKEETSARSKLKHLLVLACRCMALLFLVLAFAQPFIPKKNTNLATGRKYVSVYIDNSFSMGSLNNGVRLIDKAKLAAREIAANFTADDRFQLLSNDFSGKQQRLVSKEEFQKMVEEVDLSPAVRNLEEVTKRQNDILSRENGKNRVAYLLSDFQTNTSVFHPDSAVRYNLIPLAAEAASNVYIDTAWFYEPVQLLNQSNRLLVQLRNSSEKSIDNSRLLLKVNGQTKVITEFSIEANGKRIDTLVFNVTQPGWNKAELSIQDYPITYDDTYFGSFFVTSQLHVLSINESGTNKYADALFKGQPEMDYQTSEIGRLDYSIIKGKQLVVLCNLKSISSGLAAALQSYLKEGGAVVIFPSEKADLASYNSGLSSLQVAALGPYTTDPQELREINLQQAIFRDVFERSGTNMSLPKVKGYFPLQSTVRSNEEGLLIMKNGKPLVARYPYAEGSVYMAAVPLDAASSELPVHAIFAPMLYKMAVLNAHGGRFAHVIGDKSGVAVHSRSGTAESVYKMSGNQIEFIPEQTAFGNQVILNPRDQIRKAGFYNVTLEKSDSADVVAMNFDRSESALRFRNATQLRELLPQSNVNILNNNGKEVVQAIAEADRGTALWKWMIIIALLFLAAEVLLLRYYQPQPFAGKNKL